MTARELSFVHVFRPATVAGLPPVRLLHGAGGDETDLIGLGEAVAPAGHGLTQVDVELAADWFGRQAALTSRAVAL